MMNFTELFIKRPALTIVISVMLMLIGLMSFRHLPLRWIPNITPTIVSIGTMYPGANSSLIENAITIPIENALAGVEGVDSIYSSSKQGGSEVTLTFGLNHNMNTAVDDVRTALLSISASLPKGAEPPVIYKMDLESNPIMYIAFSDASRTDMQITSYVKKFVMPILQGINGVALIDTYGERQYAMHIWLDPMKMAAANITVDDIDRVLHEQNIQLPTGQIRGHNRNYSIVTNETLNSMEDFNQLIIHQSNNQVVRLKDIGQALVDAENSDMVFRSNGQAALALSVIPQASANPLTVADSVEATVKQLKTTLPAGMKADIVFNQATFIHASIDRVYRAIIEAVVCVFIVIFLFLGSWRAAFIPIITIPICLITTFAILLFFGMSINTITLMAFALSIGLVVDDAIVMLENISRHIDSGLSPFRAALTGSQEMIFPIIAMTLTLVAVYAPIAFTSGALSAVFREFALTLAGAVLVSGLIALSLSPMMCSRLLVQETSKTRLTCVIEKLFLSLQLSYLSCLSFLLVRKKYVLYSLLFISFVGGISCYYLPKELAPNEDMSDVELYIAAPHNASFHYTDENVKKVENIIKDIPDVLAYGASVGFGSVYRANIFLTLVDHEKRKHSAQEIASLLDSQVQKIPGIITHVTASSSPLTWFSSGNGASVVMEIMSAGDYRQLHAISQHLKEVVEKMPQFKHVDTKLKWDGEQFDLSFNRDKVSDMKLSMQSILNTVSTLMAGRNAGYFNYDGNQYSIIMQMNQSALSNPNIISQLYVRNNDNRMVPISDLVTLHEVSSPEVLPHFNRLRDDVMYASIAPGYSMSEAVSALQAAAARYLPENVKYAFQGQAKDFIDSTGKTVLTFILALIFIYLILVAQFESFIDPLIIIVSIPFAIFGAFFTLKVTGCSLNIYSDIGLVTLIGLIAKHGILITAFANKKRELGASIHESIIEAASQRLRPILMTTLAMVLGALPLALATGSGAESRQQLGWVIVGGLMLGTFFSLIVVPVAYTLFASWKEFHFASDYWKKMMLETDNKEKIC